MGVMPCLVEVSCFSKNHSHTAVTSAAIALPSDGFSFRGDNLEARMMNAEVQIKVEAGLVDRPRAVRSYAPSCTGLDEDFETVKRLAEELNT